MNVQKNKRISDVYFSGEFFFHKTNEKKGRRTTVNTEFIKDGKKWRILAYYTCSAGLVFDISVETDINEFNAFYENGQSAEHPLNNRFDIKLIRNKKLINMSHMGSIDYIPGNIDNIEAEKLIKHYKLPTDNCQSFYRVCFPCRMKSEIHTLSLKILPVNEFLNAARFSSLTKTPIEIIHPVTEEKYELKITSVSDEIIDFSGNDEIMSFPGKLKTMEYTLNPELDVSAFDIRDTKTGDSPKIKSDYKYLPDSACSYAVIGGADGPTAVSVGCPKPPSVYSVCSSLYFEEQEEIIWLFRFIVKLKEEKTVTIKGGREDVWPELKDSNSALSTMF